MPTKETLDRYYSEDFYTLTCSSSHGQQVTFDNIGRFGRRLARAVHPYLNTDPISILDFGGGDGTLATEVARQILQRVGGGIDVTIVDYCDKPIDPGDSRIALQRVDCLDRCTRGGYDLVIASAVIEHLAQPREATLQLMDRVRRGGLLYARTPHVAPFMRMFGLVGLEWDFLFPAHLHDLGQDFWEAFLGIQQRSVDFELLKSRPSIVETSLRDHFLTTLAAYAFKAPWYLFGRRYALVGGWEVLMRRISVEGRESRHPVHS